MDNDSSDDSTPSSPTTTVQDTSDNLPFWYKPEANVKQDSAPLQSNKSQNAYNYERFWVNDKWDQPNLINVAQKSNLEDKLPSFYKPNKKRFEKEFYDSLWNGDHVTKWSTVKTSASVDSNTTTSNTKKEVDSSLNENDLNDTVQDDDVLTTRVKEMDTVDSESVSQREVQTNTEQRVGKTYTSLLAQHAFEAAMDECTLAVIDDTKDDGHITRLEELDEKYPPHLFPVI
jgi:hypothetical protein